MPSSGCARRIPSITATARSPTVARLKHLRRELKALRYLRETPEGEKRDPFKLTLETRRQISGFRLERFLREKGCYVELADHRRLLFVFSIGTSQEEVQFLLHILKELDEQIPFMEEEPSLSPPAVPMWSVSPKTLDVFVRASRVTVPLEKAVHQIAAEMIYLIPRNSSYPSRRAIWY